MILFVFWENLCLIMLVFLRDLLIINQVLYDYLNDIPLDYFYETWVKWNLSFPQKQEGKLKWSFVHEKVNIFLLINVIKLQKVGVPFKAKAFLFFNLCGWYLTLPHRDNYFDLCIFLYIRLFCSVSELLLHKWKKKWNCTAAQWTTYVEEKAIHSWEVDQFDYVPCH